MKQEARASTTALVQMALPSAESFSQTQESKCRGKTSCHRKQIASITPQVWLVTGSHLGFAKTSFHSIAMTRGLIARNVARFRVVMARDLVTRGHLGFCHYERSEVIQKQMLLESRLRQSLRFFAMTRGVWLV